MLLLALGVGIEQRAVGGERCLAVIDFEVAANQAVEGGDLFRTLACLRISAREGQPGISIIRLSLQMLRELTQRHPDLTLLQVSQGLSYCATRPKTHLRLNLR